MDTSPATSTSPRSSRPSTFTRLSARRHRSPRQLLVSRVRCALLGTARPRSSRAIRPVPHRCGPVRRRPHPSPPRRTPRGKHWTAVDRSVWSIAARRRLCGPSERGARPVVGSAFQPCGRRSTGEREEEARRDHPKVRQCCRILASTCQSLGGIRCFAQRGSSERSSPPTTAGVCTSGCSHNRCKLTSTDQFDSYRHVLPFPHPQLASQRILPCLSCESIRRTGSQSASLAYDHDDRPLQCGTRLAAIATCDSRIRLVDSFRRLARLPRAARVDDARRRRRIRCASARAQCGRALERSRRQ